MKKFSQLAIPYIAWAAMMLLFPMLLIAMYSVTDHGNSIISFSVTLEHYAKFFTDPDFLLVLWRSFVIAIKTTIICLLLGYPVAFFISRSDERLQNLLVLAITLPTWINALVRTYAWIGLLSEGGLFQQLLGLIGLGDVELLYTEGAVLLGTVYNFLPFMILQINTSLCKMDQSLLQAAADLGADKRLTFMKVILPLSLPGVISGITMVFVPSVSTFYISYKLGGGKINLIGDAIERQIQTSYNYNLGASLSLVLMVFILISLAIMNKFSGDEGGIVV